MAIPETPFQGQVFRAHDPRWAWKPESGEGARLHGGRFNPRGTPALYLSLSFESAWAEAQQGFPFRTQPLTICTYEADLQRIVDLRDPASRRTAGVTSADLSCAWEDILARNGTPPTHHLALTFIQAGVAGILAPSFAPGAPAGATNLIVWRWSRESPELVQCIDDEDRLTAIAPPDDDQG